MDVGQRLHIMDTLHERARASLKKFVGVEMLFKEPKGHPERDGRQRAQKFMEQRGWYFFPKLHGSIFQIGYPDSFCAHKEFGTRWIEWKVRGGSLESSQVKLFTKFAEFGIPVYIMFDEHDYPVLFDERYRLGGNWWQQCMRGKIR